MQLYRGHPWALVVTPSRNEENIAGALIGAAEAVDEVLGSERERQRRAHEVKIEILLILQHTAGFCSNSLFYPVVHCVLRFLFFFLSGVIMSVRDEELPFQREIATIKRQLQRTMAMDGAKIKFNATASDESVVPRCIIAVRAYQYLRLPRGSWIVDRAATKETLT